MIETVADIYYARTRKRHLYNITSIDNIPSIMEHGIICYDQARSLQHSSIAMNDVQARRALKRIPNGLRLHQYANLYFTYHNPMMYKRKDIAETICVLVLSATVLDIEDCIVSDMNAAADLAMFYPAHEGIGKLDFDSIFAKYWTHENPYEQRKHKAIKCAEILVPSKIPVDYIEGGAVVNPTAEQALVNTGFDRRVIVYPPAFFR